MNDQLKQRLVGAIVLVSLAVIILPEIFKGDGAMLVDSKVPPEPDYRFPAPKEVPASPPMAKTPLVPVGDSAKDDLDQVKKQAPADSRLIKKADTDKKPAEIKQTISKKDAEPKVSKPGQVDAFVVQVGSFSSEPNAVALRNRLRKMGFSSFVEAVKGKQGMVYRVRVGPELTEELAEKLKEDLAKKAKLNGLVQSYP